MIQIDNLFQIGDRVFLHNNPSEYIVLGIDVQITMKGTRIRYQITEQSITTAIFYVDEKELQREISIIAYHDDI